MTMVDDWKRSCETMDCCSSGKVVKAIVGFFVKRNYRFCCAQHDFDYQYGSKYGITRKFADGYLRDCIVASGHPVIAQIVYIAVRVFGWKHYR